jgi:hypothetical protein
MGSPATPVGILTTVALLALYGIYCAWTAISELSWISALASVVAMVACIGTAMMKAWSRYLVYLLTTTLIGMWAYSIYAAAVVGYFDLYSARQIIAQLAPGISLIVLSCVCTYLVFRHFRASNRRN